MKTRQLPPCYTMPPRMPAENQGWRTFAVDSVGVSPTM